MLLFLTHDHSTLHILVLLVFRDVGLGVLAAVSRRRPWVRRHLVMLLLLAIRGGSLVHDALGLGLRELLLPVL